MKNYLALFLLLVLFSSVQAQESGITTFILVRHAEKDDDGTKDPGLKQEGIARAERLAAMLSEVKVDAIYSTPYKRTRNTAQPLATAKKLDVQSYEPMKPEAIDKMLADHRGGTVVVVGHSNTIPWTASQLAGESFKDFADADYNNLMIVSVVEKRKAKVTWLKY